MSKCAKSVAARLLIDNTTGKEHSLTVLTMSSKALLTTKKELMSPKIAVRSSHEIHCDKQGYTFHCCCSCWLITLCMATTILVNVELILRCSLLLVLTIYIWTCTFYMYFPPRIYMRYAPLNQTAITTHSIALASFSDLLTKLLFMSQYLLQLLPMAHSSLRHALTCLRHIPSSIYTGENAPLD